jgi:hypothetical protein
MRFGIRSPKLTKITKMPVDKKMNAAFYSACIFKSIDKLKSDPKMRP